MGLFGKLFKSYSERQIKKITPIVNEIEALEPKYTAMSDEELRACTAELKKLLNDGKTLDDILPDAFALVREADRRVLGKRPFRVQLMGGILLHQGRIAEMKTGEGKTLVATLPAYLNALSGKGVHVVTVNDYLAKRDRDEMGKVFSFLGLTVGLIVRGQNSDEKRQNYLADITYATNTELGFDYLRDNMVLTAENMVQRGHAFAIVDEVDSVLIDEARTPLIISGSSSQADELYTKTEQLVRRMKKLVVREFDSKKSTDDYAEDYIVDEKAKTAILTKNGIEKAESFFKIDNLSDVENNKIYHHINNAIRAHGVMIRDIDYVVKDDTVIIVDHFTGRLMPGRHFSDGLHQAIEAKENVSIQKESKTVATITYQNFFRMYSKLSGMTGTALTEDNEFREIYSLDVVEVPTNMPMIRIDHNDSLFYHKDEKLNAIIANIKACHEKGQPVLVGTGSIESSEELSRLLRGTGIAHNVLNAKYHEKEAEIVANAGTLGAVTISTNMAGRGTDIMLGGNPEYSAKARMRKEGFEEDVIIIASGTTQTEDEEILEARRVYNEYYEEFKEEIRPKADRVREAGGLFIIGAERYESRRIDNQLRGRSGRQGDPGESRFYISLDDEIMRRFGGDRFGAIQRMAGTSFSEGMSFGFLSKLIETAQRRAEAANFERRKRVLTYDDVMNRQRTLIYEQRREVLTLENISEKINGMIRDSITSMFYSCYGDDEAENHRPEEFARYYLGMLTDGKIVRLAGEALTEEGKAQICEKFIEKAYDIYNGKAAAIKNNPELPENALREIEKVILLRNIDSKWMNHLSAIDDLKEYVGLNSYAQRDPVTMFRLEAAEMFEAMAEEIRNDTARDVIAANIGHDSMKRSAVIKVTGYGASDGTAPARPKPAQAKHASIKRNDRCYCGSGKKYKDCCWAKDQRGN